MHTYVLTSFVLCCIGAVLNLLVAFTRPRAFKPSALCISLGFGIWSGILLWG
jgi:hypothetical protein